MALLITIFLPSDMKMLPTVISQQKQRKPHRDKLPPSEKHARHLEASRSYYARYTLSWPFSWNTNNASNKKPNVYSRGTTALNEKVIFSAIYHPRSHFYHFFQTSTKATGRNTWDWNPSGCLPLLPVWTLYSRCENSVNNNDNRSVDEDDN